MPYHRDPDDIRGPRVDPDRRTAGVACGRGLHQLPGIDTGSYAPLVYKALCGQLPPDDVFLDSESISAGADFVETLLDRVRRCDVLLALIGPDWLTASDRAGRRLIDSPADWIRRELAAAFQSGVTVIPVLTDGAEFPREADLPDDIAALGRRQYRHLRHRESPTDLARISGDVLNARSAGCGAAGRIPTMVQFQAPEGQCRLDKPDARPRGSCQAGRSAPRERARSSLG
jgi:hypothetical protein